MGETAKGGTIIVTLQEIPAGVVMLPLPGVLSGVIL